MPSKAAPVNGSLHHYAPRLVAFEHGTSNTINKLLFIGGMGDGLSTVPYVQNLVGACEDWSIVEVLISGSYTGWGSGSVKRDAEELAQCVQYFRDRDNECKIVLMGHSTGSQDTMKYLLNSVENRNQSLDGAILQAPVSDRECLVKLLPKTSYLTGLNFAETYLKNSQGQEIIPREFRPGFEDTPISAERWFSIASSLDSFGNPQGADDFFSSDISDTTLKQTFGKIPSNTPLLILYSSSDEFVPPEVDKLKLLERWTTAVVEGGGKVDQRSGIVEGGTHTMLKVPTSSLEDFKERVIGFLKTLAVDS